MEVMEPILSILFLVICTGMYEKEYPYTNIQRSRAGSGEEKMS